MYSHWPKERWEYEWVHFCIDSFLIRFLLRQDDMISQVSLKIVLYDITGNKQAKPMD
jgi:hypothetical protein